MTRAYPLPLRIVVLALLVLGSIVRPILIVGCEIHAATFAHAGDPHQHQHQADDGPSDPLAVAGADADDARSTHGEHDPDQLGAFGAAVFTQTAPVIAALPRVPDALPPQPDAALPAPYPAAPFRPPIA